MNALFLKDLADKTRRGLRGRIDAGKAGGGPCYGYEVVKRNDAAGEPIRGERRINGGKPRSCVAFSTSSPPASRPAPSPSI
jgi:site-specific DNA recombinase